MNFLLSWRTLYVDPFSDLWLNRWGKYMHLADWMLGGMENQGHNPLMMVCLNLIGLPVKHQ